MIYSTPIAWPHFQFSECPSYSNEIPRSAVAIQTILNTKQSYHTWLNRWNSWFRSIDSSIYVFKCNDFSKFHEYICHAIIDQYWQKILENISLCRFLSNIKHSKSILKHRKWIPINHSHYLTVKYQPKIEIWNPIKQCAISAIIKVMEFIIGFVAVLAQS